MEHIEAIDKGIKDKVSFNDIVRKVYLTYPSSILSQEKDREFAICNAISKHFDIPIMAIKIAGSAQLGRSMHKGRDFIPKGSDLDIAIIEPRLFQKYTELVFGITRGYSDRSGFPNRKGESKAGEYMDYILKGIFRADIMPSCTERAEWDQFFGQLTREHSDLFKSINAVIYMSQTFFESKQRSIIKLYKEAQGI
jgi:hypothetical protein